MGIFKIVAAIQLRSIIDGEWLMILSGIASIIVSVMLFLFPGEGALGLTWLISVYSIAYSVLLIILVFRLHRFAREVESAKPT